MHRAPMTGLSADDKIICELSTSAAFDHPAEAVERLETHISWLLLAGEFVYKIKKPIALPFLDFSTLAKRKHFCEEELRLNRYWAPELYVDVVPVTVCDGVARLGGDGTVVDYAVRMHRFDQAMRLDNQLSSNELTADDMLALANYLAARHTEARVADPAERDRVLDETRSLMMDNFDVLDGRFDEDRVAALRRWTCRALDDLESIVGRRFDDGHVRNCHGDLHLGNLVRLETGLKAFDCIEFSADLRHIDTICDISFLVMDLLSKDQAGLAAVFLNRYLEVTGDYEGVVLLELFTVYRSLVKAKVAVIRADERASAHERQADLDAAARYLALAVSRTKRPRPTLILMHGLSGSGKTYVSTQLLTALPAIRIRSDLERKRLAGLGAYDSSASPPGEGLYDADTGQRTYERLRLLAAMILGAGHNVIIDAAFLDTGERRAACLMAERLNAAAVIVDVRAPDAERRQRIAGRAARRDAASEADAAVLDYQLGTAEPLTPAELDMTVVCDNSLSSGDKDPVMKVRDAIDRR